MLKERLEKIFADPRPQTQELEFLLGVEDPRQVNEMLDFADAVRRRFAGEGILLRGLVEFSNYCSNDCFYCGINSTNAGLQRYRLSAQEILCAVKEITGCGIKTVVLQSGEDSKLEPEWLAGLIRRIKAKFRIAVTLSVGERTCGEYRLWRRAGADRYLLRVETTDAEIYADAHAARKVESRLKCLDDLIELGYQAGSGLLVGLKGQTLRSLARDMLFLKEKELAMVGIGPFIPHAGSAFSNEPAGDLQLTLKVLALTRILTRDAHMPATTALGSLGGEDHRKEGLEAGANVLMPNFTPSRYRGLYEIYPGKACLNLSAQEYIAQIERSAVTQGRFVDYSIGHSLKARVS
ncbi:MAG: [FeFe] hydrogenase H-cluster radical SAM maturase HydE [Candidatus Omnitrophota bacterium]